METDDIFYLTLDEIGSVLRGDLDVAQTLVAARRLDMANMADIDPPATIREGTPPPVLIREKGRLNGTPASRGTAMGRVRVVRGSGDFGRMKKGEVLVIPCSEPSWTTLFAKASAVITESGGVLSHAAIVAREQGIPAVVSVSGALSLPDGTEVEVNGTTGQITIIAEAEVAAPADVPDVRALADNVR